MRSLIVLCCAIFCFSTYAQDTSDLPRKSFTAQRIQEGQSVDLDGQFDEMIWQSIDWGGGDFVVNRPNNGEIPQRQTQFKIAYDKSYVYVAFLCLDESPEEVVKFMARRDRFPGDWVELNIDSYADENTAFSFSISASGVKGDEFISQNGNNWDTSWNPIWYAATGDDPRGWTAEIKIPLSQLRYADQDIQNWGFNVTRRDFRVDERSSFQYLPQNKSGWVSNFADLKGIQGVKPKRQVEIQPYVVTGVNRAGEASAGVDQNQYINNVGLDGKVGVTPDLTLDFTVNPDFGQVEADPSALNIDGFQIFFREQRPFFVENANLFNFGISNIEAGGNHDNDNLFYSRRIGSSPRGEVNASDEAIIDYPTFTSILGAAKFSGKTRNGLSVGILESITSKEYATITDGGVEVDQLVEPLTNYFVGRISQDINNGASQIGGTITHVGRSLDNTGLEDTYHKDAMSGGINLLHSWQDRQWQIKANFVGSRVSGTATKMLETQTSFEHYFQRPDANHLDIDSTATSMTGHGGRLTLANYGGDDNLSFETGLTWRSSGLELNDIGFMNTADEVHHFLWAGYRFPKPFSVFRSFRINYNHYFKWDFSGDFQQNSFNVNFHSNLKNFWSASTGFNVETRDNSTKVLFGGPVFHNPIGLFNWIRIGSDQRKKFRVSLNGGRYFAFDKDALSNYNINLNFFYQASDRLSIRVSPRFRNQNRTVQNIDLIDFQGEDRYITGRIIQNTFSVAIRGSYNFSPNLTLEYWGQPFISKGNYTEYKYITDPKADEFANRYALFNVSQQDVSESGYVSIDENLDGNVDYGFSNPDFNFMQWRSNMVLRYEYKPGSEFFLVWSQSTTNDGDPTKSLSDSLQDDLFTESLNNIFLMKWTYRFVR